MQTLLSMREKLFTPICKFEILKELPLDQFTSECFLISLIDAIFNGGLCQPHHLPGRYKHVSSDVV